jgi:hypothetical protein
MGTSIPKIIFDQPFLFFLRNTRTGDILFAGRMSQPEAAKQQVLGPMNESEILELSEGIFTPTPVAGTGQSVGSSPNSRLANSNTYNPPSSAGSVFNINKSLPVAQTQPPVINYQALPNNQNAANNNPLSTSYQSYQASHQVRSVSNNLPQTNTVQRQPYSYSETYQASNPDTIGQNVPPPGQSLSTSGSYVPAMNSAHHYLSAEQETPEESGVWMMNQTNTERLHFWP